MLYRDYRPNCDMCKRFFDDNLKMYASRALTRLGCPLTRPLRSFVTPLFVIYDLDISDNLGYVRPSEAEIEDCGMRKGAWPLAEISQHKNKFRAFFDYIHPSTYKRVYRLQ